MLMMRKVASFIFVCDAVGTKASCLSSVESVIAIIARKTGWMMHSSLAVVGTPSPMLFFCDDSKIALMHHSISELLAEASKCHCATTREWFITFISIFQCLPATRQSVFHHAVSIQQELESCELWRMVCNKGDDDKTRLRSILHSFVLPLRSSFRRNATTPRCRNWGVSTRQANSILVHTSIPHKHKSSLHCDVTARTIYFCIRAISFCRIRFANFVHRWIDTHRSISFILQISNLWPTVLYYSIK